MSKTVVQIKQDGSYRAAEPFQVLIEEGDTIEFSSQGAAGTILSITGETASILSPKPSTQLVIAGGSSVAFTFLKPGNAAYCCQVLAEGSPVGPINCPPPQDDPILSILSSDARGGDSKTGRGL
ncbi:MAG: hypothetical protein ABSF17_01345 [Terracidiphilus sp.]|jgi:plastocyanin